jgi:hypothetical protein
MDFSNFNRSVNTSIRTTLIVSGLIAASLAAGSAHAALQGRDLNGSAGSFEAYYDTVLDITWLADANYAETSGYDGDGLMTWADANTWAANLSFTDGVNVYDDWRLPDVNPVNGTSFNYSYSPNGSTDYGYNITSTQSEMAYMYYVNLGNLGDFTPSGAISGCYKIVGGCLDNVGPFSNLKPYVYWSATGSVADPANAWRFSMIVGSQAAVNKSSVYYAWAVSPGDVAAVPEAQTYAMMLAGLGLVSFAARRKLKLVK